MRVWRCFILGMIWSALAFAQPSSQFVVFGDSLSDNGNTYEYSQHTKPPSTFYYEGRYSNGPIWIDYVLDTLSPHTEKKSLLNYAFGGAGVLRNQAQSFTFSQEVDSYLATHPVDADSQQWFVIWIGANDYLLDPEGASTNVSKVIAELERNLLRLQQHGAHHLIILGLPDLGFSPYAHSLEVQAQLSAAVQTHNQLLQARMLRLRKQFPNTDWQYIDVNQIFAAVLSQPKHFGFSHTVDRCVMPTPQSSQTVLVNQKNPASLKSCANYVFFDQFHPTTKVHKIFAQYFLENLKKPV